MKKTSQILLYLFAVAFIVSLQAETLPDKSKIIDKMKIVNDSFMKKWPNPCLSCLFGSRPSNIWTRGVYYEGNLAYFYVSKDSSALNHALDWAAFHKWTIRNGVDATSADDQCAGQAYIELYQLSKKQERITNIKQCIDNIISSQKDSYWTWIDAIQMAAPVYTKLAVLYPNGTYNAKLYNLYNYPKSTAGLYNKTDGLWWRDSAYKNAKTPAGKKIYWSRGNGWVFAALVRILQDLPASDSHRTEYIQTFTEMAVALIAVQRTDGFWNENLADPAHFGGPELTGTALFTYGIAWGISNKILDKAKYLPAITKAWNGMVDSAILPNGSLGYVQGTGAAPGDHGKDSTTVSPSKNMKPDFDDYGTGCFLLAGSEIYKLADSETAVSTKKMEPRGSTPLISYVNGKHLAILNTAQSDAFVTIVNMQGTKIYSGYIKNNAKVLIAPKALNGVLIMHSSINGIQNSTLIIGTK